MGTKHRVNQALAVLVKEPDDSWAYETWSDGKTATFAFSQARSAELVADALRHIFKSMRPQLIHNGRKPRGKK